MDLRYQVEHLNRPSNLADDIIQYSARLADVPPDLNTTQEMISNEGGQIRCQMRDVIGLPYAEVLQAKFQV